MDGGGELKERGGTRGGEGKGSGSLNRHEEIPCMYCEMYGIDTLRSLLTTETGL